MLGEVDLKLSLLFSRSNYVVLEHDISVPLLEQLVNRRGGMQ